MDDPGCSSWFLSDHTYHREENEVEEVFIVTSSESEKDHTDHDTTASRRTESGHTNGSSPTAVPLECQEHTPRAPVQITIDNLDLTVTPHTMTISHQRLDYHWLLMVGNHERVTAEFLPRERFVSIMDVPLSELLPNLEDRQMLRSEFKELVGRVVVQRFTAFKPFSNVLLWHIPHMYSDVMAQKTEITPLGLLEVDEKVSADMVKAVQYINQRYVPYTSDLENGNNISKPVVNVILAGDQLTKHNADAAIRAKANEDSSFERLEGLVLVIADFHCSMNFNDVIFKRFYSPSSQCDFGSFFQLRNVVHRNNVTKSALGDNYRPCNTFIQDVLDASIIAVVLHHFSLHTQDDMPVSMPTSFLSNEEKQDWFDEQILNIVDTYILNESPEFHNMLKGNLQSPPQSTVVPQPSVLYMPRCSHPPFKRQHDLTEHFKKDHGISVCDHKDKNGASAVEQHQEEDCVFNYHSAFLKMGLLERDFLDSVREGDGKRTILCLWKFKMLHFKDAQRHKYSLEALKIQFDIQAMQSPRVAHRMMWNRTVNVTGGAGKNVALDLNCEHYGRYTKDAISHLGANVNFQTAQQVSRTLQRQRQLMDNFDADVQLSPESGKHTMASKEEDIDAMVAVLKQQEIYKITPGRSYAAFPSFNGNPLHNLTSKHLTGWIWEHMRKCHRFQLVKKNILT
ncbi:hypothetical protein R3I93_013931 [Phoxinus phoxinus]|uniref:DUF6589 domain-containing protein n=1 Tax=Phoxinus phoxinus TaxID=58324 RepID=A0AAN9CT79_9TELE